MNRAGVLCRGAYSVARLRRRPMHEERQAAVIAARAGRR
jgi:hypothetical protein